MALKFRELQERLAKVDYKLQQRSSKSELLAKRIEHQQETLDMCKSQVQGLVAIVVAVLEQVVTKCQVSIASCGDQACMPREQRSRNHS